jgi:hypothetical protein
MSVLSYLNGRIDTAVEAVANFDKLNRENLAKISVFQKKVDELTTEIADIEGVLAIDGLDKYLVVMFTDELKWRTNSLTFAQENLDRAKERKVKDDESRLYYLSVVNDLRAARDKYKESL